MLARGRQYHTVRAQQIFFVLADVFHVLAIGVMLETEGSELVRRADLSLPLIGRVARARLKILRVLIELTRHFHDAVRAQRVLVSGLVGQQLCLRVRCNCVVLLVVAFRAVVLLGSAALALRRLVNDRP